MGIVEVGADAARPVGCGDLAEVIAVYRAVGGVLADNAAGKAERLDAAGVTALFDRNAAVATEDARCVILCLDIAGVFAADYVHIAAGGDTENAARVLIACVNAAVIDAAVHGSCAADNDEPAENAADLTVAVYAAVIDAAVYPGHHEALTCDTAEAETVTREVHVVFAVRDDGRLSCHVAYYAAGRTV